MEYKTDLPVLEDLDGYKEVVYVEPSSSKNQKKALELMASFFKKEFNYTHLQYCESDENNDCIGVLFTERAMDLVKDETHYPNRVIGGACFRQNESNEYFLDWVWLHPFARNRKKLKRHWSKFQDKFGMFTVTTPLSAHMADFIKKHHAEVVVIK